MGLIFAKILRITMKVTTEAIVELTHEFYPD